MWQSQVTFDGWSTYIYLLIRSINIGSPGLNMIESRCINVVTRSRIYELVFDSEYDAKNFMYILVYSDVVENIDVRCLLLLCLIE